MGPAFQLCRGGATEGAATAIQSRRPRSKTHNVPLVQWWVTGPFSIAGGSRDSNRKPLAAKIGHSRRHSDLTGLSDTPDSHSLDRLGPKSLISVGLVMLPFRPCREMQ